MMYNFILEEFPTHVKLSNKSRKTGKPRYWKINGQAIYNSTLSKFTRGKAVDFLHSWIKKNTKYSIKTNQQNKIGNICNFPMKIKKKSLTLVIELHVPYNYGQVRINKGIVGCPKLKDSYKPNYDLTNLSYLWKKVFEDVLVELEIIEDDNVSIISKHEISVHFTDFEKRYIKFTLK